MISGTITKRSETRLILKDDDGYEYEFLHTFGNYIYKVGNNFGVVKIISPGHLDIYEVVNPQFCDIDYTPIVALMNKNKKPAIEKVIWEYFNEDKRENF